MKYWILLIVALLTGFASTFFAGHQFATLNASTEPVTGWHYLAHVAGPLSVSGWLMIVRVWIRTKLGGGVSVSPSAMTAAGTGIAPPPNGSAADRFKAVIDAEADRQRAEIAAHVQHVKETIGGGK